MWDLENNCFDELYVVGPGSDYGNAIWSDFNRIKNGREFDHVISSANKLTRLLHHIHFSFLLNKAFDLPFQSIWRNAYSLETINFDKSKKYFVLLPDVSACRIDKRYLSYLHEQNNICLVMYVINIMQRKTRLVLERIKYFDHVFSFSENDSDKYGFIYHDAVYSKQEFDGDIRIENDVFFAGSYSPKRLNILGELANKMCGRNLSPSFYLNGVPKKEMLNDHITFNKPLSYKEVLHYTFASNCLIEVLGAETDCGFTMRTAEALCYNKKLITNNKSIRNNKYYDPNKILVFDTVDDIDLDFIADKSPIDYGYMGDLSPLKLIEMDCFKKWQKCVTM